jgi:hypothetical protein
MFEHEPFEELPEVYVPFPEYDHYPPTLIFGFPISRDYREFRRIALAEGFIPSEKCEDARMFRQMRLSVLRHLNKQCGLKPGGNIFGTGVSSLSTNFVLELKMNYQQLVPEDKLDEVMRILKEYLPEVEPLWYLEADIDLKRICTAPSRFLVICEGVTKTLTRADQCPCLSGRSHRVHHSATRTLLL